MNTDRDKYLTEAMGGKLGSGCMLDVTSEEDATLCVIDEPLLSAKDCCFSEAGDTKETCGEWKEFIIGGVTDFSTWPGFGKLKEYINTTDHRAEFWNYFFDKIFPVSKTAESLFDFICPDDLANTYHEFLKGREA